MELQYLDFETSDEPDGSASFDALASVPASRWPALATEAATVLAWAREAFGAAAAIEEGGDWDYALHGTEEHTTALALHWDPARFQLQAQAGALQAEPRRTLALTLSCSAGVADAFRRELLP